MNDLEELTGTIPHKILPAMGLRQKAEVKLRANVRLSKAEDQQMVLTYQQTIQKAFSDVSNELIGYQKYREFEFQQAKLVIAADNSLRLPESKEELNPPCNGLSRS